MTNNTQPAIQNESEEWFFDSDDEKVSGIETRQYQNTNKVKRVKLSTGDYAVARELLGKDMKWVDKICNGRKDEYLPALMITATKIVDAAGKETHLTLEELDELKGKDYTSIKMIAVSLNF